MKSCFFVVVDLCTEEQHYSEKGSAHSHLATNYVTAVNCAE